MEVSQPEEPIATEKLNDQQKKTLIQQLQSIVQQETKVIITSAAMFALVLTPYVYSKFAQTTTMQGAGVQKIPTQIERQVTPTPTVVLK